MKKTNEKVLNEKKIAFIICTNDEQELEECDYYLRHLKIPEGYTSEVLAVTQAYSMAGGYNEGMDASDAKYKIYLHQDVFIINENFLEDMMQIFQSDEEIGMLGLIGRKTLSGDYHQIMRWDVGKILHNCTPREQNEWQDSSRRSVEVESVDGLLIATQYDVRWRDDLFTGWHFYDLSECCEFRKRGWKVVVPWQKTAWCYHDNQSADRSGFEKFRKIFVEEYWKVTIDENSKKEENGGIKEFNGIQNRVVQLLDHMLLEGKIDCLNQVFQNLDNQGYLSLIEYELISRIYNEELENSEEKYLFSPGDKKDEVFQRLRNIKFLIKRVEFGIGETDRIVEELTDSFSRAAIYAVIDSYCNPKEKERIKRMFNSKQDQEIKYNQ